MSDIDILCKEGDVPRLQEQMLIKGYFQADNHDAGNHFPNHFSKPGYYHTPLHEKIFARKQSHLPPFFIPKGVRVEVHLHIFPGMYYDSEIMKQVWKSAIPSLLDGQPMYHLCPEDQLIHLCVHLHESIRDKAGNVDLYWFCDIHEVLRYYENRIDWNLFCAKADSAGVCPEIGAVLHLIKMHWHSPVPDAVLRGMGKGIEKLRPATVFYADQDNSHYRHYIIRLRSALKIPGWKDRVRFLLGFVFPDRNYLTERYGLKNSDTIWY